MEFGQYHSDAEDRVNIAEAQNALVGLEVSSGRDASQENGGDQGDDSQSVPGDNSIDARNDADCASTKDAADLSKQGPAASETVTLFLVDDHQLVVDGLTALVEQDTNIHVVGQCSNSLEVLNKVRDTQPDVLALDIAMPGLNGLELCRIVKMKVPDTQILMLTMHSDEQVVIKALEYGATGYMIKDAVSEDFYKAVRTVARGEIYLSPGIPRTVLDKIKPIEPGS